jgi:hypothetical protein
MNLWIRLTRGYGRAVGYFILNNKYLASLDTKKFVTNWAIISITKRGLSWSYVRLIKGV